VVIVAAFPDQVVALTVPRGDEEVNICLRVRRRMRRTGVHPIHERAFFLREMR